MRLIKEIEGRRNSGTLLAINASMKTRGRSAGPARAGIAGAQRLVVLVGDGQDWPSDLESVLAREGYSTDRRDGLAAALPLLEGSAVRALLVEARPLGASELLFLRRVRESSPGTAIVVVTKTPTSPDLKRAFESGATAFLSWPASKEALRQAVDSGVAPASPGSRPRP